MKREVNIYDYMNEILKGIKSGVLLTSKKDDKVNTMTISWGQIGIEWNKPVFTTFVREHRYTHDLLESGEFTVNIPYNTDVKKILAYCGTKSGKETDKIADMNLTLLEGSEVDVPVIKELPLTLECRVVYKQLQDRDKILISDDLRKTFYPEDVDSDFYGSNKDYHTMFYGEIVSAYIIEK
jgi:flavin reductase (DIM6/NTAB) family NADH-FMN oxidoreductase RutF